MHKKLMIALAAAAVLAVEFLLILLACAAIARAETYPGPIAATVVRVVDGDSVEVLARPWPSDIKKVIVRLSGIDAPEVNGRCAPERERAQAAKARLAELLTPGSRATLLSVSSDKYSGRVDAVVISATGQDVEQALLAEGHARPYDGKMRGSWCQ